MVSSIHLHSNCKMSAKSTEGINSNAKLCLGNHVEVYMSDNQLQDLYKQIGVYLHKKAIKPMSIYGIIDRISYHISKGEMKQARKWAYILKMNYDIDHPLRKRTNKERFDAYIMLKKKGEC